MRHISRSSQLVRLACARKYYYSEEYKGGWDSPWPDLKLLIGLGVHKGQEVLFRAFLEQERYLSLIHI